MSRLVIKNLPKNTSEAKLRELFSEKGTVTDVQLKYTKEGVFRQFAFIGYGNNDQAQAAIKHFNRTCIQTSRIIVEECASLGSESKPRSWSKYSKDSKVNQPQQTDLAEKSTSKKLNKNNNKPIEELPEELKNDPKFIEFMKTHSNKKEIWHNDWDEFDGGIATGGGDDASKNKISTKKISSDSDDEEDGNEDVVASDGESDDNDDEIDEEDEAQPIVDKKTKSKKEKKKKTIEISDLLTIKIRNIPFKTKRQDVLNFFKPLKPFSIRLPVKVHGICYVGFKKEDDFKKAMLKNRGFWKGKQILFTDFTEKNKSSKEKNDSKQQLSNGKNPKWSKQENTDGTEDISDSGCIFFRNLPYTVTEDDLKVVFEEFGPISELNLPIDGVTKRIKGFGTIIFVMPENAVRAFNQLDGTIFHGRLLHLIPGKNRDTELDPDEMEGLSYKQKKELKLKKQAGSSHNWNTLFMGANAVTNILAKTYETSKEHILDTHSSGSGAAVRLALGETELVMEMKKFLEENDVHLEALDQPVTTTKRSSTVILAKNLPAETTVNELKQLFNKFGLLSRLVLPPSGVSALIEFLEPSEAKVAYRKLAYSKFKHLPLFLEWAPINIFKTVATQALAVVEDSSTVESTKPPSTLSTNPFKEPTVKIQSPPPKQQQEESPLEKTELNPDNLDPEPNTTIFLRNLNFKTVEQTVVNHFKHLGAIFMVQVARKKHPENPQEKISLGYGFIQFIKKSTTDRAISNMQFTTIDGNKVELKRSDRILQNQVKRATTKAIPQTGSKILVRNIPFQAKQTEIHAIFQAFGEIKSVRLPKRMSMGEESHRGFGFVDYYSESDAKKSFEALSSSTHLYGRRLVLEWASPDDSVEELRKRTADHFGTNTQNSSKKSKGIFDPSSIPERTSNRGGDDEEDGDDD